MGFGTAWKEVRRTGETTETFTNSYTAARLTEVTDVTTGRTWVHGNYLPEEIGRIRVAWVSNFGTVATLIEGQSEDVYERGDLGPLSFLHPEGQQWLSEKNVVNSVIRWSNGGLTVSTRYLHESRLYQVISGAWVGIRDTRIEEIWTGTFKAVSPCNSTTLAPSASPLSALGGTADIFVSADTKCAWQTTSSAPWLTVTGGTGTGNGTIKYQAAPNFGFARTGTLIIASKAYSVTQLGAARALDPNPDALDLEGRVARAPSDYNLVSAVAADGVTPIVLRISTSIPLIVRIKANASSENSRGSLSQIGDTTKSSAVTLVPDKNAVAAAVYRPPDGIASATETVEFEVFPSNDPGEVPGSMVLELRRPPVVLVHGVFSKPGGWLSGHVVPEALRAKGIPVFLADYETDNARGFDPVLPARGREAVKEAIAEALIKYRSMGIAVTQVDVVTHSMGGLHTRALVQQPGYQSRINLMEGAIRRLVTIGTPHLGTPVVRPLLNSIGTPAELALSKALGDRALGPLREGAIREFEPGSAALCNLSQTTVRAHAIGSVWFTTPFEQSNFKSLALLNVLGTIALVPDLSLSVFGGYSHDTIVPLTSQYGGLAVAYTSPYFDTIHAAVPLAGHATQISSAPIAARVADLLVGPASAFTAASDGFPSYRSQASSACATSAVPSGSREGQQSDGGASVTLTLPTAAVVSGSTVRLSAQLSTNAPGTQVFFAVEALGFVAATANGAAFIADISLPASLTGGPLGVSALAVFSDGTTAESAGELQISAPQGATALRFDSDAILAMQRVAKRVSVLASFPLGAGTIERDVTRGASGTVYTVVSGSDVVAIDTNGVVTALKAGTATLRATHGGLTAETTVTVPCNVELVGTAGSQSASAGSVSVEVRTNGASCTWTAVSHSDWISLPQSNGTGAGAFLAVVTANTTTAARTGTVTVGEYAFTVIQTSKPSLAVDRAALTFTARRTSSSLAAQTPSQEVQITQSGNGLVTWSVAPSHPWLVVAPSSGTGPATLTVSVKHDISLPFSGTVSGAIQITVTDALNTLSPVSVSLALLPEGQAPSAPFGQVDTPAQNAMGVQGAIGVTGWALDDVGVTGVKIYRNCLSLESAAAPAPATAPCQDVLGQRLVFVGDASVISGARPDVEAQYPNHPANSSAGWGFLILSNLLPNIPASNASGGGVGTFTFYVVAADQEGNQKLLGRTINDETPTTVTVANDTIAKPFGAIDTPGQGATVSGTLNNFGWALTPDSNTVADVTDILVPTLGTTINVIIDGASVGTATFNLCRGSIGNPVPATTLCDDDVSSIFRGAGLYRNLDAGRGAIGLRSIDTRTLSNGLHTIQWGVSDSANRGEGIGSRYFTVLNSASDVVSADVGRPALEGRLERGVQDHAALQSPDIYGRTGFDFRRALVPVERVDGVATIRVPEMGRVELQIPGATHVALLANGELRAAPVGVSVDEAAGMVRWSVGPGYLGTYRLRVERADDYVVVDVQVVPMMAAEEPLRMHLDRADVTGAAVVLHGWALDPHAETGPGIGAVHVWARQRDAADSTPVFLGIASLGTSRPDVAAAHGARFMTAGFVFEGALGVGEWDVTAYAWNVRTQRFEDARTVVVQIR